MFIVVPADVEGSAGGSVLEMWARLSTRLRRSESVLGKDKLHASTGAAPSSAGPSAVGDGAPSLNRGGARDEDGDTPVAVVTGAKRVSIQVDSERSDLIQSAPSVLCAHSVGSSSLLAALRSEVSDLHARVEELELELGQARAGKWKARREYAREKKRRENVVSCLRGLCSDVEVVANVRPGDTALLAVYEALRAAVEVDGEIEEKCDRTSTFDLVSSLNLSRATMDIRLSQEILTASGREEHASGERQGEFDGRDVVAAEDDKGSKEDGRRESRNAPRGGVVGEPMIVLNKEGEEGNGGMQVEESGSKGLEAASGDSADSEPTAVVVDPISEVDEALTRTAVESSGADACEQLDRSSTDATSEAGRLVLGNGAFEAAGEQEREADGMVAGELEGDGEEGMLPRVVLFDDDERCGTVKFAGVGEVELEECYESDGSAGGRCGGGSDESVDIPRACSDSVLEMEPMLRPSVICTPAGDVDVGVVPEQVEEQLLSDHASLRAATDGIRGSSNGSSHSMVQMEGNNAEALRIARELRRKLEDLAVFYRMLGRNTPLPRASVDDDALRAASTSADADERPHYLKHRRTRSRSLNYSR